MASKTQILLLLVAVMVASYGLTNGTNSTTTSGTTYNNKSAAASLSHKGIVGLPGLLIYTVISTAALKLFHLI